MNIKTRHIALVAALMVVQVLYAHGGDVPKGFTQFKGKITVTNNFHYYLNYYGGKTLVAASPVVLATALNSADNPEEIRLLRDAHLIGLSSDAKLLVNVLHSGNYPIRGQAVNISLISIPSMGSAIFWVISSNLVVAVGR
jgi:hypothetical protein